MEITLKNPIKVDGKQVKKLKFDTEVWDLPMYDRAADYRTQVKTLMTVFEMDPRYHMIVARLIIEASSNGTITYDDLARVRGTDIQELARAGRAFLLESGESPDENSEDVSEPIVESTTPVQK